MILPPCTCGSSVVGVHEPGCMLHIDTGPCACGKSGPVTAAEHEQWCSRAGSRFNGLLPGAAVAASKGVEEVLGWLDAVAHTHSFDVRKEPSNMVTYLTVAAAHLRDLRNLVSDLEAAANHVDWTRRGMELIKKYRETHR